MSRFEILGRTLSMKRWPIVDLADRFRMDPLSWMDPSSFFFLSLYFPIRPSPIDGTSPLASGGNIGGRPRADGCSGSLIRSRTLIAS